jgi:hypothetical protein
VDLGCLPGFAGLFFMRTIHGAYPTGQRFALLKIAPGNFFISMKRGDVRQPHFSLIPYVQDTVYR